MSGYKSFSENPLPFPRKPACMSVKVNCYLHRHYLPNYLDAKIKLCFLAFLYCRKSVSNDLNH